MYIIIFVKFVAHTVVRFVFQLCIVKMVQPTTIISLVITIHFLHPVAQCTITPLNPTTMTATGGALVSGTMDVMIRCTCTGTNDDQHVRWYHINTIFLNRSASPAYVDGSPHYILNSRTDVTLVIPTFNDSYDGTYNCGIRVNDTSFTSPSAAVNLTITSELMINTVSYLYVAT